MREDSKFFSNLQRLIVVGGAYGAKGDITPVSEFNMWFDPESARDVLGASSGAWLIGMDVAGEVRISRRSIHRLIRAEGAVGRFLSSLMDRGARVRGLLGGGDGFHVSSGLGVIAAARAEYVRCVPARVEIDAGDSAHRGASAVLRWGPQQMKPGVHRVARQVKADACLRWILAALGRFAEQAGGSSEEERSSSLHADQEET
jgi:inosine-uridine nucleoside N-ribohydrolase